jgi:hypothetical protein
VKFRALSTGLAVDRPGAPLGLVRNMVGRMPVPAGHDDRQRPCSAIDSREDSVAVWNRQSPTWAEIDLRVDDQKCITFVGI